MSHHFNDPIDHVLDGSSQIIRQEVFNSKETEKRYQFGVPHGNNKTSKSCGL